MPEPPEVAAAIRSRDPRALDHVVRGCLPSLLRAARAAGLPPDRAEDAVQAALLIFVQRAAAFDGRVRVCTWIHGILWRKVREEWRAAGREADHKDVDVDAVVEARFGADGRWSRPPAGPVEALLRGELRRELEGCLAGLPDRQRVAFVLREVEGYDTAEICNILEVTANNLGVLLFRARNRLRECLEARGFRGSRDAALS
jgi:RNA polymerase sigma-70 factor (ECF subfamily)